MNSLVLSSLNTWVRLHLGNISKSEIPGLLISNFNRYCQISLQNDSLIYNSTNSGLEFSLITGEIEDLFMCLLAIFYWFLVLGCSYFTSWFLGVDYIFWIIIICQWYIFYILSPCLSPWLFILLMASFLIQRVYNFNVKSNNFLN